MIKNYLFQDDAYDIRKQLKNDKLIDWKRENKKIDINDNEMKRELFLLIKNAVSKEFNDVLLNEKITMGSDVTQKIKRFVTEFLNQNDYEFENANDQVKFIGDFIINFSGYGVLQPLIDDEAIEEIYVLGYDKVYINKEGKRELTNIKFASPDALKTFVDNILSVINRRIDSMQPIEDAHLPDYNRVAVSGDVLSPQGFTFNIRKFRKEKITLDKMVGNRTIDEKVKDVLIKCVKSKMNYIISGGTSSGKTTLLNAIADYFENDKFVITIEDNLELQLGKEYCLQLETRKPNIEGKGEVTMAQLFKHILRRSPDRIVIGEIRDGEVANTFISATNTGHDGCGATVHSNSPKLCRNRIAKLIANSTKQSIESCIQDFNEAINVVFQISFLPTSNRRVITDIVYVCDDGQMFQWVKYDYKNDSWVVNDNLPSEALERFARYGIEA